MKNVCRVCGKSSDLSAGQDRCRGHTMQELGKWLKKSYDDRQKAIAKEKGVDYVGD